MSQTVSIITPNFNKGDQTRYCVESVLAQTYPNFEHIFIDDGSTDSSFEVAKNTVNGDERFLFLKNTSGIKGANSARNLGIEKAKGEYILFLDSDDLMAKDCLETRVKDMEENPDLDFITYPMGIFNDKVGDSDLITNIPKPIPDLVRFLNRDNPWLIAGPIWKKSALLSLNCFDLSIHSQQDNDLHIRAVLSGLKYAYKHRAPQVFYRQNTVSIPRQKSQSLDFLRQRFEMNIRHFHLIKAAGKLGDAEKLYLSRYILDIAQMMRWHINTLQSNALTEALDMWKKAYELQLMDCEIYRAGARYIKFKHNMRLNQLPALQRYLEKKHHKKLGDYIHTPSSTLNNSTLNDYEG